MSKKYTKTINPYLGVFSLDEKFELSFLLDEKGYPQPKTLALHWFDTEQKVGQRSTVDRVASAYWDNPKWLKKLYRVLTQYKKYKNSVRRTRLINNKIFKSKEEQLSVADVSRINGSFKALLHAFDYVDNYFFEIN